MWVLLPSMRIDDHLASNHPLELDFTKISVMERAHIQIKIIQIAYLFVDRFSPKVQESSSPN